jgi:hypothetical protein
MPLKSPDEEKAISDKLFKNSSFQRLTEQMDEDYRYVYDYNFKMPKKEGDWENFSTNLAQVLAWICSSILSSAQMQLYVMTTQENRESRLEIANTEKVALGTLFLADRIKIENGGKSTQDELSWSAYQRGGTIKRVWLREEEDGDILLPDIRVYDPYNCRWEQTDRLHSFRYRFFESPETLKLQYPKDASGKKVENYVTEKNTKKVLCEEIWYPDQWGIRINDKFVKKVKIPYKRMPVSVNTCGVTPVIQSERFTETLKHSWQSAFFNNRKLYDKISEVISILLSRAKESGQIKGIAMYDSTKSGGAVPNEMKKLGYTDGGSETEDVETAGEGRTKFVFLDKAKGQEFHSLVSLPQVPELFQTLQLLLGMDVLGSMDPIAIGSQRHSGMSGTLAAQLRSSAIQFLNPFFKRVSDDIVWIAGQICHQYKTGEFEKSRFRGLDSSRSIFDMEITADEMSDKELFICELVEDTLRDEAQEVGIAIQSVSSGLMSRRTAMQKHNIVDNPDAEMELIQMELAEQDPVFRYDYWAKSFADKANPDDPEDYNARMALYCEKVSRIMIDKTIQGELMPPMMPSAGQNNPMSTPQTQSGYLAAQARRTGGYEQQ